MDRTDLQRLSREELIELVLQLQRPDKTSRTSSLPPSTDKKEKRENAVRAGPSPVMSRITGGWRTLPTLLLTTSRPVAGAAAGHLRRMRRWT
jgi:hypothetical protein